MVSGGVPAAMAPAVADFLTVLADRESLFVCTSRLLEAACAAPRSCAMTAHVMSPLTDTSHELSAESLITVRHSAVTAALPPRALLSYDVRP